MMHRAVALGLYFFSLCLGAKNMVYVRALQEPLQHEIPLFVRVFVLLLFLDTGPVCLRRCILEHSLGGGDSHDLSGRHFLTAVAGTSHGCARRTSRLKELQGAVDMCNGHLRVVC